MFLFIKLNKIAISEKQFSFERAKELDRFNERRPDTINENYKSTVLSNSNHSSRANSSENLATSNSANTDGILINSNANEGKNAPMFSSNKNNDRSNTPTINVINYNNNFENNANDNDSDNSSSKLNDDKSKTISNDQVEINLVDGECYKLNDKSNSTNRLISSNNLNNSEAKLNNNDDESSVDCCSSSSTKSNLNKLNKELVN